MNDIKIARNIFETSNNACDCTNDDYTFSEIKEILQEIIDNNSSGDGDYHLDTLANGEVRIISKSGIGEIWHDSLIETVKDCYDLSALEELPAFIKIAIDWDATVEACKIDGMGHHFASYDHEEHSTSGYYIFRTN